MSQTATLPAGEAPLAPAQNFTLSLQELLEDGIYLLFLLRNGNPPNSLIEFNKRVDQFLNQFEANARNLASRWKPSAKPSTPSAP